MKGGYTLGDFWTSNNDRLREMWTKWGGPKLQINVRTSFMDGLREMEGGGIITDINSAARRGRMDVDPQSILPKRSLDQMSL